MVKQRAYHLSWALVGNSKIKVQNKLRIRARPLLARSNASQPEKPEGTQRGSIVQPTWGWLELVAWLVRSLSLAFFSFSLLFSLHLLQRERDNLPTLLYHLHSLSRFLSPLSSDLLLGENFWKIQFNSPHFLLISEVGIRLNHRFWCFEKRVINGACLSFG